MKSREEDEFNRVQGQTDGGQNRRYSREGSGRTATESTTAAQSSESEPHAESAV